MLSHNQRPKPSPSYVTSLIQYLAPTTVVRTLCLLYYLGAKPCSGNDISNEILPGLFLGAIPVKQSLCGKRFTNSHQRIIQSVNDTDNTRPLELVLSIVEPNELKGQGFFGATMVSPQDWKDYDVEHRLVKMADYQAEVNSREVISAVQRLKTCIDGHRSAYVHCKAGCGRSAMVCAIYMAAYVVNPVTRNLYTIDEAVVFLKQKRKQVALLETQMYKAREILAEIRNEQRPSAIHAQVSAPIQPSCSLIKHS